jgi:hypothetical protein
MPPSKALTSTDPRRPDEVQPFIKDKFSTQHVDDSEIYTFFSLLAGTVATIMRIKPLSWIALVFSIFSIANARSSSDTKAHISSLIFSLFALQSVYLSKGLFLDIYKKLLGLND